MYQERQVAEQALRVRVSSMTWAIIISRSSCGNSLAYELEVDDTEEPRPRIVLILALLPYQTTLLRRSNALEPRRSNGILTHGRFDAHL